MFASGSCAEAREKQMNEYIFETERLAVRKFEPEDTER
jgi:hypothetical protein